MTKANLTLPNGTSIQIDGTPDEVKELLGLYSGETVKETKSNKKKRRNMARADGERKNSRKDGPIDLIRELIGENYFKGQKRGLSDIQKKLEERGHIYAQTSLSTPLIRLTKSKELRRLKEKKGWMYVI